MLIYEIPGAAKIMETSFLFTCSMSNQTRSQARSQEFLTGGGTYFVM